MRSSLVYGSTTNPSFTRTSSPHQLLGIRKQRLLSPITSSFTQFENPTSRPSRAARIASSGRVAAGGIWQNKNLLAVDVVEQRFLRLVCKVHAPHRDGHHIRARSSVRPRHLLKAAIFPGSHDKPRLKPALQLPIGLSLGVSLQQFYPRRLTCQIAFSRARPPGAGIPDSIHSFLGVRPACALQETTGPYPSPSSPS